MESHDDTRSLKPRAAKRILYVEHHEDSRFMLTLMLERAGYDVTTAETLSDGVSLIRPGHFDLYVLGSRFPDGTGIEFCRLIRVLDLHTPVIFYSSAAYGHDIEAGLNAGAQCYLTKPEGIYDIEQTIAKLLVGTGKVRANGVALPYRAGGVEAMAGQGVNK